MLSKEYLCVAGFGKDMDHMVNVVVVEGEEYLVDVGFAKHTPSAPIPLQECVIVCTKWEEKTRSLYSRTLNSNDNHS